MGKSFLHFSILVLILSFIISETCTSSFAQAIVDTNKGNHINAKVGIMDGNWVETVFYNYGQVADWLNFPSISGVWPKGTNHTYVDGVALIVQAEAQDPLGNFIHPLETNYYEFTRHDPTTGVTYGWWPLPGYANPNHSSPARSDDPNTWPDSWPDRPHDWDGMWNGYFGKGVTNADLETFFVFDDNEDRQYILSNQFYPDTSDITRGGLGIQIKARGFQWNIPPVENVIFWHYDIINMGTTDYNKILFAQYVDWAIGGRSNSSSNANDYDELLDISYAWCHNCPGGDPGGWLPIGLSAYAFLESSGISDDIEDNDTDGLHDERRDNEASVFIEDPNLDPYILNVFQDTTNFREFYGYSWRPHWDADENGNWVSYFDLNENGQYDEGEPLNDDLGSDGIGPGDEGYVGPDPDGTEGNGFPDQGEPNFGILDKDESDQLGLTGFQIFAAHTYELHNDEENWEVLSALPAPHGQSLIGVNLANYFSSYFFSLAGKTNYSLMTGTNQLAGETQRYSMALMFALSTEEIFNVKRTIQNIYNNNYQIDSTTSIEDKHLGVPSNYLLYQNYPNPFNPITKIKYSIPLSDNVQIKIYDILGREIKTLLNEYKQAGTYEIEFDASNLLSGVYFYSIISGSYSATKKLILIK